MGEGRVSAGDTDEAGIGACVCDCDDAEGGRASDDDALGIAVRASAYGAYATEDGAGMGEGSVTRVGTGGRGVSVSDGYAVGDAITASGGGFVDDADARLTMMFASMGF